MWTETFFRLVIRVYDIIHRPGTAPGRPRAPRKTDLSIALFCVLGILVLLAVAVVLAHVLPTAVPTNAPPGTVPARVFHWKSGDIVRLNNIRRPGLNSRDGVRLAGIDAPENYASQHSHTQARRMRLELLQLIRLGFKAHEFAETLLPHGSLVYVDWDTKTTDPDGRPAVFLWNEKHQLVQEEILRAGWADLDPPTAWKYSERLRKARDEARAARRGIWQVAR